MDARRLDAAHHLDRAGQLAFQRAHPCHFLHERGEAERAELVVKLVADVAAMRQALLRKDHARLCALANGRQDVLAVGADVEADAGFRERRADADDVVAVEAGIERLLGRAA